MIPTAKNNFPFHKHTVLREQLYGKLVWEFLNNYEEKGVWNSEVRNDQSLMVKCKLFIEIVSINFSLGFPLALQELITDD